MRYDEGQDKADTQTLALFALVSAATIGLGSLGLALHGAPLAAWIRNPAAWITGMLLGGILIGCGRTPSLSKAIIAVALCALTATFFAPAQTGVHRWVDAGPLHINIAALLLPVTLAALATLRLSPAAFLMIVSIIGAILAIQPDASQSSAFLLASAFLLVRRRMPDAFKLWGLLVMISLAAVAWLRPDPILPVPEVEGIFELLAGVSGALAASAALGLAVTALTPLRGRPVQNEERRAAAIALATYFAMTAALPLIGNYPVPLVGIGMSFPVGYWLGMALLCSQVRRPGR